MFDFVTDLRGMRGMFYMTHSHVERMHTYLDLSLDIRYKVVKIVLIREITDKLNFSV